MAHQFEVIQATLWRATAAGARLAVPSGKKQLSQAKQLTTLAMPAHSRKPRHAECRHEGSGPCAKKPRALLGRGEVNDGQEMRLKPATGRGGPQAGW